MHLKFIANEINQEGNINQSIADFVITLQVFPLL